MQHTNEIQTKTIEKRSSPRITAKIPVVITPEFIGETIDLNKTGSKIILSKVYPLSKGFAILNLFSKAYIFKEFKIIWAEHLISYDLDTTIKEKYIYGIRFKNNDIDLQEMLKNLSLNHSLID